MSTGPADRIRELSALPIWVAPMAGGPSTAGLVAAAAQAGGFGFLAGGYKTADGRPGRDGRGPGRGRGRPSASTSSCRARRPATPRPWRPTSTRCARRPSGSGPRPGEPRWDDDGWADKIGLLLGDPPPVVSFTFGCPPPEVIAEFRRRGHPGGHHGDQRGRGGPGRGRRRRLPDRPGPRGGRALRDVHERRPGETPGPGCSVCWPRWPGRPALPLDRRRAAWPTRTAIAGALASGATAAALGTAFLRCPESGAHPLHKAALADPRRTATAVTRAFSGRPARALVNRFVLDHPDAPAAYPEINNATRALRARAAAAGDPERMSLYAGQGFRAAADLPAGEIIGRLAAGVPR